MKKTARILLFALILSAAASPASATIRSEVIHINQIELRCDVSDFGLLQIMPTESRWDEIWLNDSQETIVNLDGIKGLKGYALQFYPSGSIAIEFDGQTKVTLSEANCMQLADHAGGKPITLTVAYEFSSENQICGIELTTYKHDGKPIEFYGYTKPILVSLPLEKADEATAQYTVMEKNAVGLVPQSYSEKGVLYAYINEPGKYGMRQAEPKAFDDELPAWAEESINWLSAREVIQGDGERQLSANRPITRAEFAEVLTRLLGKRETSDSENYVEYYLDFADTPAWASFGMTELLLLFDSSENGACYNPNKDMSRRDMFLALYRYISMNDMFYDDSGYHAQFEDLKEGSTEFHAIETLDRMGLIRGYDNKINLDDPASRAQAFELFYRFSVCQFLY